MCKKVIQPSENFIYEIQKLVDEEREKAKNAYRKVCDRTVEYYRKKGSARNIRKEKKCLSGMERKKRQNKDSSSLER